MIKENTIKNVIIHEDKIKNYFFKRETEEYLKIKNPINYLSSTIDYFNGEIQNGSCLPFNSIQDLWRLRLGELTVWTGYSGHGKSMVLNYIILHLLKQQKCLIASFEMTPKSTLSRFIRQSLGSDNPTESFIEEFLTKVDGKLWLYDQLGSTNPNKVLSVIYYGAEQLGIKHFVIDSLMKCSINEDDYNSQKKFVDQLCIASRDLNIHIHLVVHSRKTIDEMNHTPSKFDVMGSSNITNLADNVCSIFRNKKKEEQISFENYKNDDIKKTPDAYLILTKQRHYEWEGKIPLWFETKSLRYRDSY
jgi:twinkle protein